MHATSTLHECCRARVVLTRASRTIRPDGGPCYQQSQPMSLARGTTIPACALHLLNLSLLTTITHRYIQDRFSFSHSLVLRCPCTT